MTVENDRRFWALTRVEELCKYTRRDHITKGTHMMKKTMGFTLVTAFLMLMIYCTKDMTSPEIEHLTPGSRNYTWELDTLAMPMNYISSVWGASPTDVWAVGGGGTYKDRLQHYDGETWSAYTKESINILTVLTSNMAQYGYALGFYQILYRPCLIVGFSPPRWFDLR